MAPDEAQPAYDATPGRHGPPAPAVEDEVAEPPNPTTEYEEEEDGITCPAAADWAA